MNPRPPARPPFRGEPSPAWLGGRRSVLAELRALAPVWLLGYPGRLYKFSPGAPGLGRASRIFAAIDLGTTTAKLVLFDEGLRS